MPDYEELVGFVRARLDEDYRIAKRTNDVHSAPWQPINWGEFCDEYSPDARQHQLRHDPARVLREVEAKKRVIDGCAETLAAEGSWDPLVDGGSGEPYDLAAFVLRMLTLPYSDHQDYREEWAP
jgi:hypothetical protein